ncbi:hypothetical protein TcG_04660 [Trypanosoma cruzi]|nr:hypothetical protein TcG_04660 [Trypanosoma cruzi]
MFVSRCPALVLDVVPPPAPQHELLNHRLQSLHCFRQRHWRQHHPQEKMLRLFQPDPQLLHSALHLLLAQCLLAADLQLTAWYLGIPLRMAVRSVTVISVAVLMDLLVPLLLLLLAAIPRIFLFLPVPSSLRLLVPVLLPVLLYQPWTIAKLQKATLYRVHFPELQKDEC